MQHNHSQFDVSPQGRTRQGLLGLLERLQARWGKQLASLGHYGSILISLLLVAIIVHEVGKVDFVQAWSDLPLSPLFYLAFAGFFLGSPLIEWTMLRRLWNAPFSGFWAMLRKMVYNDMVMSYLGDAYLFAWIRRELPHVRKPLAAVKDMAIVSAFMGSITTLAAVAIAWPHLAQLDPNGHSSSLLFALALPLASGGVIACFRKSLLSLPRRDILWIGAACGLRNIFQNGCAVLMWWSLMPGVALSTWMVLCAVRMVATRMPLVPNKDLIFAAATMALVGQGNAITPMIVMITSLILLSNIALAVGFSLSSGTRFIARRRMAPV